MWDRSLLRPVQPRRRHAAAVRTSTRQTVAELPLHERAHLAANVSDVHEAPEPGSARRRGFHAHSKLLLSLPAWQARDSARCVKWSC